ncbi:uncharacterized protein [Cicer arietinum]|uniref:Uncharacterized protein LOC101502465 n=1 Tax=Cicer arietinum TaxID=3827 RepID=A0A1S2YB93_CICAR|nr:uncharacterized protein LOC101502465 [Cicer arietinum]
MMRTRHQEDEQSRALYELSAIVLNLLRSPPIPFNFSDHPLDQPLRRSPPPQISPTGFASLLLGISMALMLCGSVTFFIGFVLMPWVIGLVILLYVAGIVSTLSDLGRSILCYVLPTPDPRKDIPAWKLM